ncbi:ribosomal RNA-processing protein 8 isoform X2 [Phodopus roborovskii]|uniref:Ribosomal RNA-processing protein 8 n=1 Tax=Phodopus roborovskii TaxID=109678 RepID=A0AAU9ZL57_PHORO|nr:ribosomal RNA-processing protein 8 isoform X2 [Phodopus roborovskii]CAH6792871.1 Rrp8 [Phodopus roborovskii]
MFEEPEWAEAAPAAVGLSPATIETRPATAPPVKGRKRRHLLATLRALEAASLSQKSPSPPGSDSEEEEEVGRKKKYLQKPSLAHALKERKRKCQKQVPSVSDSENKEIERKCQRQTLLGGVSAEEKGKRKCQKYSHSHPTQHLNSVDHTVHNAMTSTATVDPPKPSSESTSCNSSHTLSRRQWRNRQKNKRKHKNKFRPLQTPDQVPPMASTEEPEVPPAPQSDSQQTRAGALRARMTQRLDGARFRYLNEQLYSGPSSAAQRLFQEDPEAFLLYHRGFQKQVKKWPLHPVDRIAKDLRQKPASLVVADFGCGDCRLASSIRNPVHCFDLASLDPRVTVCDMAQVPLEDESVDVAVFCLSLMGTNIRDFLEEANRVLKPGGLLKVAEVSSRFEDIRTFLGAVTKLGFKVIYKDLTNSHFFLFDFEKTGPPRVGPKAQLSGLKLQPCLYKRR